MLKTPFLLLTKYVLLWYCILVLQSVQFPKKITVSISLGYNSSDTSFGWNGYNDGFTVYYPHFTHLVEGQQKSFSVASGLMPVVEFQNVERMLLGKPFSDCVKTKTRNNYNFVSPPIG